MPTIAHGQASSEMSCQDQSLSDCAAGVYSDIAENIGRGDPRGRLRLVELSIRTHPSKRAPLGSALLPYFRAGLYPGFCPPLAGMEDHFSDAATGRPSRACARACASSALRPTALLPTGFGYAAILADRAVGSYPTFSPLPSRAVIFCATFRRRGMWPSPPRLSTGVALNGVRKFLPPLRASDPPAVPENYCAAAAASCSGL